MFTYNIAKTANRAAFQKACLLIEEAVNTTRKAKLLEDVDGSLVQTYHTEHGDIDVFNDFLVDAVYVDSAVDLSSVFNK